MPEFLSICSGCFFAAFAASNRSPFRVGLMGYQVSAIAFEPGDAPASLDFAPLPRDETAQRRSTAQLDLLLEFGEQGFNFVARSPRALIFRLTSQSTYGLPRWLLPMNKHSTVGAAAAKFAEPPREQVKLDSHPQNRYHQLTRNKGGRNKLDDIRPLCPMHYEAMIFSPDTVQSELDRLEIIEKHGCACPVEGCSQMYSLSLGYFIVKVNDDYWSTTRSPSHSVVRNGTQAICGEHESAMFIESFDGVNKLERFRCAQNGCTQTMNIPSGGPPTYWLGSGYFRTSK